MVKFNYVILKQCNYWGIAVTVKANASAPTDVKKFSSPSNQ